VLRVGHKEVVLEESVLETARDALYDEFLVCCGKECGAAVAHIAWNT
jgi:hypothetical protein